MQNCKAIPQFHRNPRFRKTIFLLIVLSVVTGMSLFVFSGKIDDDVTQSKKHIIQTALDIYYQKNKNFPENLQDLVTASIINYVPTKNNEQPFSYTPIKKNNSIVDYYLEIASIFFLSIS